jgi:mRNA interferase RelE/StbE
MAYRVFITPSADRVIAKLPQDVRRRVADRIAALAENPRPPGSVKLTGEDTYRIRVGDYRILYSIHDDQLIVMVIDVGHRGDVYRRR